MKLFPKLSERNVDIDCGNGQTVTVPKLTIEEYSNASDIIDQVAFKARELGDPDLPQAIAAGEEGKKEMLAIISGRFPEEIRDNLWRLDYLEVIELLMYMAFGSGNDELRAKIKQAQKKTPSVN
jgi:hypothetical protein